MKRFLIIALVFVSIVVLMTVPAFAAGDFVWDRYTDTWTGDARLPPGMYTGRVCVDLPALDVCEEWYDLEPFDLNVDEGQDLCFTGLASFVGGGQQFFVDFSFYEEHGDLVCEVLEVVDQEDAVIYILELVPYSEPVTGDGAVESVFAVFTGIGGWLVAQLSRVSLLFYVPGSGLTLLGVVCAVVVAFAVVYFAFRLIVSWLKFRK